MTAGGTREPLDGVRFLGNRSSGRMGAALADEAARARRERASRCSPTRSVRPEVSELVVEVETTAELEREALRTRRRPTSC